MLRTTLAMVGGAGTDCAAGYVDGGFTFDGVDDPVEQDWAA